MDDLSELDCHRMNLCGLIFCLSPPSFPQEDLWLSHNAGYYSSKFLVWTEYLNYYCVCKYTKCTGVVYSRMTMLEIFAQLKNYKSLHHHHQNNKWGNIFRKKLAESMTRHTEAALEAHAESQNTSYCVY